MLLCFSENVYCLEFFLRFSFADGWQMLYTVTKFFLSIISKSVILLFKLKPSRLFFRLPMWELFMADGYSNVAFVSIFSLTSNTDHVLIIPYIIEGLIDRNFRRFEQSTFLSSKNVTYILLGAQFHFLIFIYLNQPDHYSFERILLKTPSGMKGS